MKISRKDNMLLIANWSFSAGGIIATAVAWPLENVSPLPLIESLKLEGESGNWRMWHTVCTETPQHSNLG